MGVTLFMLAVSSMAVLLICYLFMRPILYLFGASDQTYPYAAEYLHIYLIGTPFVMLGTGMNGFINAQGFARIGMLTVLLGAVANLSLIHIYRPTASRRASCRCCSTAVRRTSL